MNDNLDFPDEDNEGGTLRWMSIVIAVLAIGGFFALAWYAYHAGTATMTAETDVSTVHADAAPMKEAPEDAGGWQVPHQDKTVYDAISPSDKEKNDTVERIVPDTEEPTPPVEAVETPSAETAAPSAGSDNLTKTEPEEKVAVVTEKPSESTPAKLTADNPVIAVKPEEVKPAETETKTTKQEQGVKVVEMTKSTNSGTAPKRVELKPVSPMPMPQQKMAANDTKPATEPTINEVITQSEAKKEEKPAEEPAKPFQMASKETAPVTKPSNSGAGSDKIRVQLGAFKSESEANASWSKISKKFPQLADKKHTVTKADLGAKGIYYRLQAMPFASSDQAKSVCNTLTAKGQGCLSVKVP